MVTKAKTAKKAAGPKKAGRSKKSKGVSLLKYLPESLEHIELVKQVACVLEDMKDRVGDVKHEASKELSKLVKLYEGNYKDLEKKLHKATSEAKQQAQISMITLMQKWHEHKEKLPAPLTKEIEKLVVTLGTKAMKKKTPAAKPAKAAKPATAGKKRGPGRPRTKPPASDE